MRSAKEKQFRIIKKTKMSISDSSLTITNTMTLSRFRFVRAEVARKKEEKSE
jgi:hypothetical protein